MLLDAKRTIDPRDNLDKARLRELVDFAHANGMKEINANMPADDIEGRPGTGIRGMLRAKGLTRIPIPRRILGAQQSERTFPAKRNDLSSNVVAINADELAAFRAWQAQQKKPPAETSKPIADMTMAELRRACKAKGISMTRKDNMESLRAKLA